MLAYQSPTGRLTRKKVDDREMSQCTDGTGFLFHRWTFQQYPQSCLREHRLLTPALVVARL